MQAVDSGAPVPRRTVVITFDDGYDCLHRTVLPILQRYGFPATIYMVSNYVGRMADFDAGEGIPPRQLLSRQQLLELHSAGIEIGAHSATHADLPTLSQECLIREVSGSKAQLEDILGIAVSSFAYPKGRFNRRVRDTAEKAGYSTACSTMWGLNTAHTDRFALRRAEFGTGVTESEMAWKLRLGATPSVAARSMVSRRIKQLRALLRTPSAGVMAAPSPSEW